MGKASRRRAEKRAAWQTPAVPVAQGSLLQGIDPVSPDPTIPVALTRELSWLFREAKQTGNVDPPITLIQTAITATLRKPAGVTIACKKGCSSCCHIWVSVSAPEALSIAKIVKQRGLAAIEKVRSTHEATKDYDFVSRGEHPFPCPLLENDTCSIYDARPKSCRFASSIDAEICARSYINISNEDIPMPAMHVFGRDRYTMVMAAALRDAGLRHQAYEFNAALVRALEIDDAEQRWLAGEDVFAGIHRDPEDIFAHPQTQALCQGAFPGASVPIHVLPKPDNGTPV
jgi:hypothetical protein